MSSANPIWVPSANGRDCIVGLLFTEMIGGNVAGIANTCEYFDAAPEAFGVIVLMTIYLDHIEQLPTGPQFERLRVLK
jgi:hypothetical protein